MAQWQMSTQQADKRNKINFDGGLNAGTPSFYVKDNESIDEYGWDTDAFPALHTRKGRTPYGISGAAQTNLLTNFNTTHLVRSVGTKLQYWNGTAWTDITGTFTDTDWDATNFEVSAAAALVLTNGTDSVKYWNGTALANLNANAPKGKYITNDAIRLWIAKGDIIYFSAFLDGTDWTTAENSGSVEYYTQNGGDITGLRQFQTNKYVWKQSSMAVILGTDYFNFRLIEVSDQIGCVSFKTIQEVETPNGSVLFWLGQNDVYIFNGGNPVAIGQKIRSYLTNLNAAQLSKCVGGTDGMRYFLGLVTGANTQPDTWLMYDPRYSKWRLVSLSDNFRYSANLNNVWYIGNSSGQTYQMQQGNSDNGTAITWMLTTKDFDEGMPEAEKEYTELHVQLYAPTGTTFTLQVSTDQGTAYTTVGDPIMASAIAQNVNVIVPLDTVPITNWIRFKLSGSGEVKIFEIQRYFRIQPVQI